MRKALILIIPVALGASVSLAADLSLSVQSGGLNAITVAPGATVNYEILGTLSTAADNEGLALFGLTLAFDGGDLPPADVPVGPSSVANPMPAFVRLEGITNPDSPCPPACGFGGTIISDAVTPFFKQLVQIGGGQNTIVNTAANAPFPIGGVITGLAQTEMVLVTGSLTAPGVGVYHLVILPSQDKLFANVITLGETGTPFWAAETAGVVTPTNLTITVEDTQVPAAAVSWESMATHARGVGEVGLLIPTVGRFSEPRLSGISKIVVTFDSAVDPTTATAANVVVSGCDESGLAIDIPAATVMGVVTAVGDTQMVVTFTPKLPNSAKYSVALTGVLTKNATAGTGPAVVGDVDRELLALLGDANGDGRVAANDVAGIRSFVGTNPIDPSVIFQVRSDANIDGRIAANDVAGARSFVGNDLRAVVCP